MKTEPFALISHMKQKQFEEWIPATCRTFTQDDTKFKRKILENI